MLIHCAQQSQDLRVKSREAAIDELGSAASSTKDVVQF